MTTEDTTAPEEKKHLFVLSYPDRAGAEAAIAELTELQRDQFLEVRDHAIVSKDVGGQIQVKESKDADPGAQRGAVAGALGAAFIALAATPIGAGAIVVGAGVGAVAGALRDTGFKTADLTEVGRLMQDGRALLLVAVKPEYADRLRTTLEDTPQLLGADRYWVAEVSAKSKNVLADAIYLYRQTEMQQESEG